MSIKNNQFLVDLGNLTLQDKDKDRINVAIQKAITGELANLGKANSVGLFPVKDFEAKLPNGDKILINGIIIRDLKVGSLENVYNSKSIKIAL